MTDVWTVRQMCEQAGSCEDRQAVVRTGREMCLQADSCVDRKP
jgi:hypothetical protein